LPADEDILSFQLSSTPMRTFLGLKDLLFGERATLTMATPRGPVTRRVTRAWLEKMQAEGMADIVPLDSAEYALVHVLDAERGYSTLTWKIPDDVPADVAHRLRDDSGELFVVRASDAGVKRSFGMTRAAWLALQDQPWSAAAAPPPASPVSIGDPEYPLPLKAGLAAVTMANRIVGLDQKLPDERLRSTARFRNDGPFWSRIFAVGVVIGIALLFRHGWRGISVSGILLGLLTALNYAGYAALVVALIPILLRLYWGARVHRRHVFSRTLRTAALYSKSTNASDLIKLWPIGLVAVSLLAILASFVGVWNVLGLSCFVLVTFIGGLLGFLSPPGILFLGASSPRALDVLATLRQAMACRVAGLLDTSATTSESVGQYMSLDNFRATDHAEWRDLVAALTEICLVTVLDTATPTDHVLFEASEAFRRGALDNIVFVSDASGRFPVLERLFASGAINADQAVYVSRLSNLEAVVRSSLWHHVYKERFPGVVQATSIAAAMQSLEPQAPRSGYLEIDMIRANPGTLGEFEFCDRDRTSAAV
jgi:hypothetical protein